MQRQDESSFLARAGAAVFKSDFVSRLVVIETNLSTSLLILHSKTFFNVPYRLTYYRYYLKTRIGKFFRTKDDLLEILKM